MTTIEKTFTNITYRMEHDKKLILSIEYADFAIEGDNEADDEVEKHI